MSKQAAVNKEPYRGLEFARLPGEQWPRRSLELTEIRHPEFCQSCGTHGEDLPDSVLTRWREFDDGDRTAKRLVVLCGPCSGALIKPHPRLYDALYAHAPWPGCMPLCVNCRWRRELHCAHTAAKANGGEGVALTMPQPFMAFVDGRRLHRQITVYNGPVSDCAQREAPGEIDVPEEIVNHA